MVATQARQSRHPFRRVHGFAGLVSKKLASQTAQARQTRKANENSHGSAGVLS